MAYIDKPLLEDNVHEDWVDYNGHMNDAAYALVFSEAVGRLMDTIGINEDFRTKHEYSIYTLETHLIYLMEAYEGQSFHITVQLLDYDEKRLHVFFVMKSNDGDRLATSEQMLMGIDMKKRRSAPFPPSIMTQVQELANASEKLAKPNEAGRAIGIRHKKNS